MKIPLRRLGQPQERRCRKRLKETRGAGESFSTETENWAKRPKQEPKFRFLRIVRLDLSDGCVGSGVGAGASQQGSARRGWHHDQTDCGVRLPVSSSAGLSGSSFNENMLKRRSACR